MERYFVDALPFKNGRTGIKEGAERKDQDDAPGCPKTKTAAEIPEGLLGSDEIRQIPNRVLEVGRKICIHARGLPFGCIMRTGLEDCEGGATEIWASCTGSCLDLGQNIPEQAIRNTASSL